MTSPPVTIGGAIWKASGHLVPGLEAGIGVVDVMALYRPRRRCSGTGLPLRPLVEVGLTPRAELELLGHMSGIEEGWTNSAASGGHLVWYDDPAEVDPASIVF